MRRIFLSSSTHSISYHLTSKLNSKTVPVLPSPKFPFHILPSPVHPTGVSSYKSSQTSLPFSPRFPRTKTTNKHAENSAFLVQTFWTINSISSGKNRKKISSFIFCIFIVVNEEYHIQYIYVMKIAIKYVYINLRIYDVNKHSNINANTAYIIYIYISLCSCKCFQKSRQEIWFKMNMTSNT